MKTWLILVAFGALLGAACKKENNDPDPSPDGGCPLRGTFVGTSTKSTGTTAAAIYTFHENNFATGKETTTGPDKTFGGYQNNCDSVYISVYYQTLNSYYLLKAKLLNNMTRISGTYNNLTTPSDFGTFVMDKQ
jgi:hypothetical protein